MLLISGLTRLGIGAFRSLASRSVDNCASYVPLLLSGQDVGVPSLIAALRLFKPFCFCSRTPHEPFDIAALASLVRRLISARCRSFHCALDQLI
jgi:hypothetical protein